MSFMAGLLVGRSGGAEQLGLYALAMTVVLLATDLQVALVSTPFMVRAPELSKAELDSLVGQTMLQQAAFLLIAALATGLAWLAFRTRGQATGIAQTIGALFVCLPPILARDYARRVEYARNQAHQALRLDGFVAVAQAAGLAVLFSAGRITAVSVLFTNAGAAGLGYVAWVGSQSIPIRSALSAFLGEARRSFILGRWVLASGAVWAVATQAYPWMLAHYFGARETGLWAACLGVLAFVQVPLTGLQHAIGPELATARVREGLNGLVSRARRWALGVASVLVLAAIAFGLIGEVLVHALYGPDFTGVGATTFVLALSFAAAAAAFPFSRGLFVLRRAELDFAANFVPIAVLLGIGATLTQRYGTIGAAVGMLAANVVAAFLRAALFNHAVNKNLRGELAASV